MCEGGYREGTFCGGVCDVGVDLERGRLSDNEIKN